MIYRYLEDESYYIDLYDLFTIKECLEHIESWQRMYHEEPQDKAIKEASEIDRQKAFNVGLNIQLMKTKADRYERKQVVIAEWVEHDRKEQDFYDSAVAPGDIVCPDCHTKMEMTFKHLEHYSDTPLRVLFFFDCVSCEKRKGVYNTGEEYVAKPKLCSKCNEPLIVEHKKEEHSLTTTETCSACNYTKTEVDDFEKSHAEFLAKQEQDKALLEKHREEYCSDKEGKEAFEMFEALEVARDVHEGEKQSHDNVVYERSLQLNKLDIPELEKLLTEALEKERYAKFSLEKPAFGRHVTITFSAMDGDSSRKGDASTKPLEKLIKSLLEDTNWRLMSNGISYRLGYVSGELKGYESEEDILALAGKRPETPQPKANSEKRMKYSHHPMVQFARLSGQLEGIENVRKRRLSKEPDGFFLEGDDCYSCGICFNSAPAHKIWWNLDGLRCADCRRNIEEGVIPHLSSRGDNDTWLSDHGIERHHGLTPQARRKLVKEGVLRARELKRADGSRYYTVYLVEENAEFLKTYPKIEKETLQSG